MDEISDLLEQLSEADDGERAVRTEAVRLLIETLYLDEPPWSTGC